MIEQSHRRLNILTGEWILVSPHRTQRPWQGKVEQTLLKQATEYDRDCYLCPNNKRANGDINPTYNSTFIFDNDFSAFTKDDKEFILNESSLLQSKSEKGICRVICFSPKHNLTLAELEVNEIIKIIEAWQEEYKILGSKSFINYVLIFENKGEIMGCSNQHPHGQIWAQESIPNIIVIEQKNQLKYYNENGKSLLSDYLNLEKEKAERIIFSNDSFTILVPFWASWQFETMIISNRQILNILHFTIKEVEDFADIIKVTTVKYDNIFKIPFPYSAGIHQAPTDNLPHNEWHFHMHFYPPLLRSATIKKFMVGYELLAEPQRDFTPENAAKVLRNLSNIRFNKK